MHVALIVDEERLLHEQPTLNRLSIGLIGEGVRLTRVVPEPIVSAAVDEGEQRIALATRVAAPMRVLPWMRRDRASRLVAAMEKDAPDVLYAMGESAWAVGLDVSRTLDRPLAVDVWSAGQIRSVPRGRAARTVAAYVAPTRPMARSLRERVDPELVCLVPLGVALPSAPRAVLEEPQKSIAIAVIGGARDVPAYRALLNGLSRVVREMPQVQVFLELNGPNEHEIWRHVRKLNLLEHISALTDASQHRALLTRCDILMLPEQFGELRSIMLEAMSLGMPVIAGGDPFLDMLVDDVSASIVEEGDAEEWGRRITRVISEPETARRLGAGARDRVAAEHRSSDQVSRLIDVFERVLTGGSYAFGGQD